LSGPPSLDVCVSQLLAAMRAPWLVLLWARAAAGYDFGGQRESSTDRLLGHGARIMRRQSVGQVEAASLLAVDDIGNAQDEYAYLSPTTKTIDINVLEAFSLNAGRHQACDGVNRTFACVEKRRAKCKQRDDLVDRGCGSNQVHCDDGLFRGSGPTAGDFISCCDKRNLISLLDFVDETFCGRVPWALHYSTLLAAIRHKDLMDWESGLHIVVHAEDMEYAKALLLSSSRGFRIVGMDPPITRVYLSLLDTRHLDIHWASTFNDCTWTGEEWFHRSWLAKPFNGRCIIQGRTLPCPTKGEEVLAYLYGGRGAGGGWRTVGAPAAKRCSRLQGCSKDIHGFTCAAPAGVSCAPDHKTGLACSVSPSLAALHVGAPNEPGCYILMKSGCPKDPSLDAAAWHRVPEALLALTSSGAVVEQSCIAQASRFNDHCGTSGAKIALVVDAGGGGPLAMVQRWLGHRPIDALSRTTAAARAAMNPRAAKEILASLTETAARAATEPSSPLSFAAILLAGHLIVASGLGFLYVCLQRLRLCWAAPPGGCKPEAAGKPSPMPSSPPCANGGPWQWARQRCLALFPDSSVGSALASVLPARSAQPPMPPRSRQLRRTPPGSAAAAVSAPMPLGALPGGRPAVAQPVRRARPGPLGPSGSKMTSAEEWCEAEADLGSDSLAARLSASSQDEGQR